MIELTWLDESTGLMKWKFHTGWTPQNLVDAFQEYLVVLGDRTSPVAILLDLSDDPRLPPATLRTFPQLGRTLAQAPVKAAALAVLAETSHGFQSFMRIFNRVYSRSMETFTDREKALEFLHRELREAVAEQA